MTSPLPPLDGPVAVKPLEWTQPRGWPIEAQSVVGSYKIWAGKDLHLGHEWLGEAHHASIDDAKAAAQADYEQRIRSALVPVAAPAAAGSDEVDELELALCRAYERGAQWVMENPGIQYLPKAARDYADKTISTTPALTADKVEIARLTAERDTALAVIKLSAKARAVQAEHIARVVAEARAEASESRCAALMAERYGLRKAVKTIAFMRPLGPSRNKTVEIMERVAIDALGGSAALEAQEAPDKQA